MSGLFEDAPSRFIKNAATDELRTLAAKAVATTPYFWFIFNEAPLYDRFNWAIHHATDELGIERYEDVPSKLVPFNQHILTSLEHGLGGWTNSRWGAYSPPI